MATGLQIARNRDMDMRFMTLTTSRNRAVDRNGNVRTLRQSFQNLRNRIFRATVEKAGFQGFKLNRYYCLRTSEGNGVLHIIFWGGNFIPVDWLSRTWEKIHGAYIVNIEYVHNKFKTVNGLVGYLLDRYLLNQPIERMSYGWMWAWLGFCKSWNNVKDIYGHLRKSGNKPLETQMIYTFATTIFYREEVKRVLFKDRFRFAALEAWRSTLKEIPVKSRKVRLTRLIAMPQM